VDIFYNACEIFDIKNVLSNTREVEMIVTAFSGTRWWISMLGTSNDIVCDKEVPFGGLVE
jgi:hypothetical protein